MKYPKFLAVIIIFFFSISCSMVMEQFKYDTPTPELYNYVDKAICLYPAYELEPSFEKSLFREPASKYFSPQFKSVNFASSSEEAKNVEADIYIQMSFWTKYSFHLNAPDDHCRATIKVRCYDSNGKLILTKEVWDTGQTPGRRNPEEKKEAIYKAMNLLAKRLANELKKESI